MDVAAAADDHILLAAGDAQIARLVDPPEIASHKPAGGVERGLGSRLVVEIAQHQAGAAPPDLADLAGRGFDSGVVPAPDPDFVALAGATASLDDAGRRVVRSGVLVR